VAIVLRREITWIVTEEGHADIADMREALGDGYKADVASLQDMMAGYFSGDEGCTTKQGSRFLPWARRPMVASCSRFAG
jgi:hypothetical protein